MFRSVSGMYGSGLPRASSGMLPLTHGNRECPCAFDVFTAWEGPQIVTDFNYPGSTVVSDILVRRQLQHYPYDAFDGDLIFTAAKAAFVTTVVTGEIIHDTVDASEPTVYGTNLAAPADLSDLVEAGPIQPLSITGAGPPAGQLLTVHWTDAGGGGGGPQTAEDDGMGNLYETTGPTLMTGSSINYCTREITIDFNALGANWQPAVGTNITLDYTTMGNAVTSSREEGTISGGDCAAGAPGFVDYAAWEGYVFGVRYNVGAGGIDFSLQPNDIYYIYVDNTGAIAYANAEPTVGAMLCDVEIAGGAVVAGSVHDRRLLLNDDQLDYYYYNLFVYDYVSLAWHKCVPGDRALAYDSQTLQGWLWRHLPIDWRQDDSTTSQQLLPEATLGDGQVVNINEDHGQLRGQLYRFLKWFGLALERDRAYIRAQAILHIDVDRAPPAMLYILATVLDFTLPRTWDIMRQRLHVKQCTELYRRKGRTEAILMAAYRITGITPTYDYMHTNIMYTNDYGRTTLDTTAAGGIETLADPHFYAWGPDRPDHHHERGLSLFFADPTGKLLDVYTRDLLRDINVGVDPVFSTANPVTANRLYELDEIDFIQPNSLTISWTAAGAWSMTDDGYGGFLLAGAGDPANSSVNYQTGEIVLSTVGNPPDAGTDIICTFTSTNRSLFRQLRAEINKARPGTVHVAYFINNYLLAVSE